MTDLLIALAIVAGGMGVGVGLGLIGGLLSAAVHRRRRTRRWEREQGLYSEDLS
jgi:hypothetical protein